VIQIDSNKDFCNHPAFSIVKIITSGVGGEILKYNTKNREMLNTLTSFRFFAAMLVFFFHANQSFQYYQTGYQGVTFFFILSGFILSYTYKTKFFTLDKYEVKKFYVARIAKIYPIHILTFFISLPWYFMIPLDHTPILYVFQALTNISLIHSFIPFGNVSFNGVSWSLSVEMFFYLIFPFLIFSVLKIIKDKKKIFISLLVIWGVISITLSILPNGPDNNFIRWVCYFFPVVRVFEFLVGLVLGVLFLESKDKISKYSTALFSLLEFTSITLIVLMVLISPNIIQNLKYSQIFIPFWGLLIIVFAFQKGIISYFISSKVLVYLGEVSFSFYMVHMLVITYVYYFWEENWLTMLLCFVISLVLSSLLYKYYEEPMRKKVRKYLNLKIHVSSEKVKKAI
jgi:peptidoglycan/LPS O-acetylase OafA/YrhL